jgi:hypothetical protein
METEKLELHFDTGYSSKSNHTTSSLLEAQSQRETNGHSTNRNVSTYYITVRNQHSTDGIATDYGLDDRRVRVQILVGSTFSSYPMGTRALFQGKVAKA